MSDEQFVVLFFFFYLTKTHFKKNHQLAFSPQMTNQVAFVVYKDQDQFKGNVQFSVESVDIDSMLDWTYSVLYHDFNLYLQGNSIEKKMGKNHPCGI